MRKWLAALAVAVVSTQAAAAPVDVFVRRDAVDPNVWRISAIAQVDNGMIALSVTGFSGMVPEPLPQISVLDTRFDGSSSEAHLTITSLPGLNLVPLFQPELLLATLIGPGVIPCGQGPGSRCGISSGDDAFGFTVLNQALDTAVEYSLTVLPEPATSLLLGLGLASLALVRRSA